MTKIPRPLRIFALLFFVRPQAQGAPTWAEWAFSAGAGYGLIGTADLSSDLATALKDPAGSPVKASLKQRPLGWRVDILRETKMTKTTWLNLIFGAASSPGAVLDEYYSFLANYDYNFKVTQSAKSFFFTVALKRRAAFAHIPFGLFAGIGVDYVQARVDLASSYAGRPSTARFKRDQGMPHVVAGMEFDLGSRLTLVLETKKFLSSSIENLQGTLADGEYVLTVAPYDPYGEYISARKTSEALRLNERHYRAEFSAPLFGLSLRYYFDLERIF